jgi:hypothetical protein
MRLRRTPTRGPFGSIFRCLVVTGLCLSIIAVAEGRFEVPTADMSTTDAIELAIWKKRIKRLKPADPESTEEMLARDRTSQVLRRTLTA